MRTRSVVSADVSSRVWVAGKAEKPNVLVGSVWPGVGRRWLPTWLPRVEASVVDHRDESATVSGLHRQLTSRRVVKEVEENARSAADLVGYHNVTMPSITATDLGDRCLS